MDKKNFRREIISLLVFMLVFSYPLTAQDISFPELKGFKKELNYPVYTPDDLWDYINGAAESYNALGFIDLHIAEYIKGKNIIKLEIYQHTNDNMAFGIYALERAPSYSFTDLGVQGYRGEDHIHFYKGRYYVKISTHSASRKAQQGLDDLAAMVDNMLEGKETFPEELALFPSKGLKANEEMYIADNVLGHEFLRNAFKASYDLNGKNFDLYLFSEADPDPIQQMAAKYLSRLDLGGTVQTDGKVYFMDGYNGPVYLAWSGETMVLINGLDENESELANNLIKSFIK